MPDDAAMVPCGIAEIAAGTPALMRAKRIACRAFCPALKTGLFPGNCCFDTPGEPVLEAAGLLAGE